MNINDLEICEVVESDNQIIGGKPDTFVQGSVKAKPGKAKASVLAVGVGDKTSAATITGATAAPKYGAAYYAGYASAIEGTKTSYKTASGADSAAKPY
ncbi:hypothetical protein [Calothrix sp. CCY 0018]|uniref:hypothetical protein n=1 Tax=Calothrix sp. CCY 0018 TaxID=3103864 RepID=UPI0039C5C918